ncbi:MAG: ABC transporter ATP-binding protein, partial [Erysipelotrichaceae bacterium]|nr:ABC transporter ATP-binding protein [Erysipelotrichaceae bacterium]
MKRIFHYLKPFWLSVLAVILFTYVQVQTELSLPDYMSAIVTNGIQYSGITEDMPAALTKSDYEELFRFCEGPSTDYESSFYTVEAGKEARIKDQTVTFKEDVLILEEGTFLEGLQMPLVYYYLSNTMGLDTTNVEAIMPVLKEATLGLEDNFPSMAKLGIAMLYDHVGLSVASIQSNYILKTGAEMLGIAFIGLVVQLLSTYLSTKISARVAADMRKDVFEKVESFSSTEFSKFSTSSLITRTGNDITKVQQLVQMLLRMVLMAPMMGLTAVFKVVRYPAISWILLVAVGIILGTLIFMLIVAVPKFEKIQKLVDRINSVMREFLDGMLVIRAFNSEKTEEKRFDDTNSELTRIDTFVSRCMTAIGPIMTFVMNGLTIAITWFAAKQIDIDAMTIGDMMAFIQYAMHVVMSFMFVSMTFFMVPRSLVSVKRIGEVLDTQNEILDKEDPLPLPEENGDLVFDHVYFKYPGAEEYVLEDISFEAKPGETVAFIGSTGSGKSTVIKLIPRLFDVTEGSIRYCGQDIRDVAQADLHERIGYAPQKAVLFTGDIASNIAFGREVSDKEMKEAIEVSQSTNIIKEKEEGIHSEIVQGGTNVSGGQRQRLSIARALAKKENIYIF